MLSLNLIMNRYLSINSTYNFLLTLNGFILCINTNLYSDTISVLIIYYLILYLRMKRTISDRGTVSSEASHN